MNTTEMVQIALDLAQLQELPLDSSVSVPGENITRVLAGIDMGAAELTLARQLGYDCVARHHNMVPRLGKLGELVAQSHYEKLVHYGVPVNVAQKLLEHRKRATEIMFHGSNLDGGPSVARLLGMPYLGLHTPADLLGERMVEATYCRVKASPSRARVSSQMACCSARLRQPETGTMVRPPPTERMQAASSRAARRSRSTWGWSRSTGTSSGGAPSWRGCARSIRTSGPWQVCSRRSRRGLMLPPPAGSCG